MWRRARAILFENLGLKFASLVLAFLLYVHVVTDQERERVVLRDETELEYPAENEVEHREEKEWLQHRPDVSQCRSCVLQLELGRRQDLEDAELMDDARRPRSPPTHGRCCLLRLLAHSRSP